MACDKSSEKIQKMFNEISSDYDFMNNLISLGSHIPVKYLALRLIGLSEYDNVLDLCCGTGDFTRIISKFSPKTRVIGLDSSIEMLKTAKIKNPKGVFVLGDCLNLPFGECEFDVITMGFGLRNIFDRKKALSEIYRVLKFGGKFLHLDFGKNNIFCNFFDIFVNFLIKIVKKNAKSYKYLLDSKNEYPEPEKLIKEFEQEGFKFLKRRDFMFGVVSALIFTK